MSFDFKKNMQEIEHLNNVIEQNMDDIVDDIVKHGAETEVKHVEHQQMFVDDDDTKELQKLQQQIDHYKKKLAELKLKEEQNKSNNNNNNNNSSANDNSGNSNSNSNDNNSNNNDNNKGRHRRKKSTQYRKAKHVKATPSILKLLDMYNIEEENEAEHEQEDPKSRRASLRKTFTPTNEFNGDISEYLMLDNIESIKPNDKHVINDINKQINKDELLQNDPNLNSLLYLKTVSKCLKETILNRDYEIWLLKNAVVHMYLNQFDTAYYFNRECDKMRDYIRKYQKQIQKCIKIKNGETT